MTDNYSEIEVQKYSDLAIWIPLTNQIERIEVANFDGIIEIQNFNGRLEYESMISKNALIFWLFLDWAYTYEIIVNDQNVHTLPKQRHCPNGDQIFFAREQLVRNIRIDVTDVTYLPCHSRNDLNSLRLMKTREDDLKLESGCHVKLKELLKL